MMAIIQYTAPFFSAKQLIYGILEAKSYWFVSSQNPSSPQQEVPLKYYTDGHRKYLLLGTEAKETASLLIKAFGGQSQLLQEKL